MGSDPPLGPPANDILSWVKGHKISKVVVMANSKFEYKFIDEPENILKCSICLEVAKGHFCVHLLRYLVSGLVI